MIPHMNQPTIHGKSSVSHLISNKFFQIKMVFNDNGAILFPVSSQHRDNKRSDISYEDDSNGNALAAMIDQEKIEIRLHRGFSPERVGNIIRNLLRSNELSFLIGKKVSYGAERIL